MRGLLVVITVFMAFMAAAAQAEERRVGMAGMAYEPAIVEAKLGDTLVFANDDSVAHAVFVPTLGFSTDLGSQDPGSETTLVLGKVGMFDVECVFHDHMHARVIARP